MTPLLEAPLAIVDLETTGTHPAHDRITEIAVLEVDGGEVAREWSTLVDPQTAIPAAIQALTGITNEMVAGAPAFAQLAGALHERLAGRVFVAHNARFDYGFLRHAFERAGFRFEERTLCTVRLSRRLYPSQARHDLDSVMARHHLACDARHRALGDARVVWRFLQSATREHGIDAVATAARQLARQTTLPAHIDRRVIDAIPEAPGVYLFYGEDGTPLYVGRSLDLRSGVLQHFSDGARSSKEMQLARELRSIDWQRTAGELGALLREAQLVRALAPRFNRRRRHTRVAAAVAQLKAIAWPYRGPIGVVEEDPARDATEVHVLHQWAWLGCARSEEEIRELLGACQRPAFDLDQYRILARHLGRGRARVVNL